VAGRENSKNYRGREGENYKNNRFGTKKSGNRRTFYIL